MARPKSNGSPNASTATIGFEAKLWLTADKLRNNMDAAEYKHADTFRRALIEADLVDCMVALPGQLFYSTQNPVCLWFLAKDKSSPGLQSAKRGSTPDRLKSGTTFRDRRQQTLFIDARKLGTLIDRVHRELTDADLEKITSTYHAWRADGSGSARAPRAVSGALAGNRDDAPLAASARSEAQAGPRSPAGAPKTTREGACAPQYADLAGFCKSATTAEIAAHGHVLTPGRYVGAEAVADDGDPFIEKMPRLVAELHAQFGESAKLEQAIKANLRGLGYGV